MFRPRRPALVAAAALLAATLLGGCANQPKAADTGKRSYSFWPSAPNPPHIQFLAAFNSSRDINPATSGFDRMVFGAEAEQTLGIGKPYGVRMWNGRIYICDIRGAGVTVLDLRKQQTRMMGVTGQSTIRKAVDIAVAPDGTKYVVDAGQNAILVFNPEERYLRTFALPADARPVGAAVSGDVLYVTDFKAAHVKVLDRNSGRLLRTFGERGGGDGQFIGPVAITVDRHGNVFVSDAIRARVQKFSPDGAFLLGFGQAGNRPGDFIRPKHMGVGSDDHLHVVDASFNNVQVFDPEGRVVGYYGTAGTFPGAMDLPAGLDVNETDLDLFQKYIHPAFQAERLILVANQFGNQKISVYAMGQLKRGKTVADIAPDRGEVVEGALPATQPASTTQPSTQPAAAAAGASEDSAGNRVANRP